MVSERLLTERHYSEIIAFDRQSSLNFFQITISEMCFLPLKLIFFVYRDRVQVVEFKQTSQSHEVFVLFVDFI